MTYITGVDRQQTMLLPETLEDYIAADHPVRLIDAFIEGLNLSQCGFARTEPAATGRPPYAPGDLLKLYLWGYLNQTRSSRRLESECKRNLEVLWLMRKLQPDFKTIADFRKDNAKAFKMVFRQFSLLCRELNLFGRELIAIDGTKLKAVNNPARNLSAEQLRMHIERIDARLEEFLQALDQSDSQEQAEESGPRAITQITGKIEALRQRQEQYQRALQEMDKSGARDISLTDPDSRRMHKVKVGYNGQIAVDDKHKLIVEAEVVNAPTDHQQLAPMAQAAKETLGEAKIKAVADGGYYDNGQIAACEAMGVETYLPRPRKGSCASEGRFDKTQFQYDAASDTYLCPCGAELQRETRWLKRGEPHMAYANAKACRQCADKSQCTTADYRRITRWEGEAALDRMHARVEAAPELMARRKALVEHPFGSIKFWMNHQALLMRGLEKVRAEFCLSALSYNFKRVTNLIGTGPFLEHLKKRRGTKELASLAARLPVATEIIQSFLRIFRLRLTPRASSW